MGLIHRTLAVGPFQCNCHILADEAAKEAIIIDPGGDPSDILEQVKDLGVRVRALIHTHCHVDHITGTRRLKEETGAKILIHREDRWLYENLKEQFRQTMRLFGVRMEGSDDPLPVDEHLEDGGHVAFGGSALRVLHTPGHTPGSCCFALEDDRERRLFSGDTLFAGSIGRTDLWGGDHEKEIRSIRARLFTLDAGTVVWPGHGPRTTIVKERTSNPFLQ